MMTALCDREHRARRFGRRLGLAAPGATPAPPWPGRRSSENGAWCGRRNTPQVSGQGWKAWRGSLKKSLIALPLPTGGAVQGQARMVVRGEPRSGPGSAIDRFSDYTENSHCARDKGCKGQKLSRVPRRRRAVCSQIGSIVNRCSIFVKQDVRGKGNHERARARIEPRGHRR